MFPKIFSIGDFFLPTYGALVALAFLVALWVTTKIAKEKGLNPDTVTNLAVACAFAGIIGAKLTMYLFDWRFYSTHLDEILAFSTLQAAGVYQGGLILAIIVAYWYMKKHGLPFLATADLFTPGLAIAHAIGRIGCFAAGCCYGERCDLPWAVTFTDPDAARRVGVPLGLPLHPTQLYEAMGNLVIFAILWKKYRSGYRPGELLGYYLILYSVLRFVVEFFRHHEQALPFGLPLSLTQWISVALLGLGIFVFCNNPKIQPDESK